MIKIYNIILRLFSATWTVFIPKTTDILLYDNINSEHIIPLISKKFKYRILHTRYEKINFYILLKSLDIFFSDKIKFKGFYENYLIKFIKARNPRVIITFIDNNFFFFSLKKEFPDICFICIQNGLSAKIINKKNFLKQKKIDFFFCFSEIYANFYKKNIAKRTHVIGSLKCNQSKINALKNKNKLIFISSFNDLKKNYKFLNRQISPQIVYKPEFKLLPIIYNYCVKEKIDFSILLKSDKIQERSFYIKILEDQLKLNNYEYLKFCQKNKNKTSYEKIKNFDTVISIDSTLGIEAINFNVKSIFFNVRGKFFSNKTFEFGWPKKFKKQGFCWTNQLSEKKINNILKKNLNLTLKEWKLKAMKNNFDKLMFYDYKNRIAINLLNNIILKKNEIL